MGKVNFTPLQKKIFENVAKNQDLSSQFYFTGGTALSAFHLQHRYSEDLDFFSENDFTDSLVNDFMHDLAKKINTNLLFTRRDKARIFTLEKKGEPLIKVDFVHYPYKRLKKGERYKNISIDSLLDIATNKLLTINQRSSVKDFVDLYFLLDKFTVWDLYYALPAKFHFDYDIILIGSDFLKAEDFTSLPRMIKPLSLPTLKRFFREKAKELGRKVTIP